MPCVIAGDVASAAAYALVFVEYRICNGVTVKAAGIGHILICKAEDVYKRQVIAFTIDSVSRPEFIPLNLNTLLLFVVAISYLFLSVFFHTEQGFHSRLGQCLR